MSTREWKGGAKIMNELYEELGLSIPEGYADAWDYHNRPDRDNLAHKFNVESSSRRWDKDKGRAHLESRFQTQVETNRANNFWKDTKLDTKGRIIQTPDGEFPTEMIQSLDIADIQTSELLGERGKQWGIDAEDAQEIETAFIDKVWGTDGALADSLEGGERAWDDPDSGFDATWGLDLRRVYDKDLNLSTSELTDYLAEGPIDWKSYDKDQYYGPALEKAGINITDANLDESWRACKIRELTYKKDESTKGTGSWLSKIAGMDNEFPEPTEWEGMYDEDRIQAAYGDLYIDGERQETILERLDKDRYKPGEDEEWQANKIQRDDYVERDFNDLKTKEYRSTLGLPSRTDFGLTITPQKTQVKKPTNLPV